MKTSGFFYVAFLAGTIIPHITWAKQVDYEKATQLIVCASVYQLSESMLQIPVTGKSSDPTQSAILHNKKMIYLAKAVQASSQDFVTATQKRVIDALVEKTMDEYAVFTKNEKISYSDFLLMKFGTLCGSFD